MTPVCDCGSQLDTPIEKGTGSGGGIPVTANLLDYNATGNIIYLCNRLSGFEGATQVSLLTYKISDI